MKLHGGMGRLGIRKRFFTESVVRHWKWCLEMVAMGPQAAEFEKGLTNALRNMAAI